MVSIDMYLCLVRHSYTAHQQLCVRWFLPLMSLRQPPIIHNAQEQAYFES